VARTGWLPRYADTVAKRHGVSARDRISGMVVSARISAESGSLSILDWKPPPLGSMTPVSGQHFASVHSIAGGLPPFGRDSSVSSAHLGRTRDTVIGTVVRELGAAGAVGPVWPALLDYGPELRNCPPFNTAPEFDPRLLPMSP